MIRWPSKCLQQACYTPGENDKVIILASSLPPSWEQLVINILVGKTTLNFNVTVAYLLEVESLKKL